MNCREPRRRNEHGEEGARYPEFPPQIRRLPQMGRLEGNLNPGLANEWGQANGDRCIPPSDSLAPIRLPNLLSREIHDPRLVPFGILCETIPSLLICGRLRICGESVLLRALRASLLQSSTPLLLSLHEGFQNKGCQKVRGSQRRAGTGKFLASGKAQNYVARPWGRQFSSVGRAGHS